MLLMQAGDSFTDVLRERQWLICMMNWAAASQIAFGHPYQSKPLSYNHCLSGLSATRVTTMWLKQPTCFLPRYIP